MAATPTFDYLTIVPDITSGGTCVVQYILKSDTINFRTQLSKIEQYDALLQEIFKYLDGISPQLPQDPAVPKHRGGGMSGGLKPEPAASYIIPLIRIYGDSITIRVVKRLKVIPRMPLRSNPSSQLIKIPFSDITAAFPEVVDQFIRYVDQAARTQIGPAPF